MKATSVSKPEQIGNFYDANYNNFQNDLYAEMRREAFGEDIGQNSWLTAGELDTFLTWLNLESGKTALDVACGSGGPALRMASRTGAAMVGIDVHEQAIVTAKELAARQQLADRAKFLLVSATEPLPFSDASFDAITCIDAINHLADRPQRIAEWRRLLKPGGRLLFTNPVTMTGPLTKDEIRVRASIGYFVFVPFGYDRKVIEESGLRLLFSDDVTANMAEIAAKRYAAREKRSAALRKIEGDEPYQGQQNFLSIAARIAAERRLSRFLYVCEK